MKMTTMNIRLAALLLVILTVSARAEQIFGVTANNSLVRFSSTAPATVTTIANVTGLGAGEQIFAIDFRPATGQLFGLGSSNRLYVIDQITGAATPVGAGSFTPALAGSSFDLDFDPVGDFARIVSNTGQNLRVNPATGNASAEAALFFAATDPNSGQNPQVSAAAFSNSLPVASSTTLYVIDRNLGALATLGNSNGTPVSAGAGQLFTVGNLGASITGSLGFDIGPSGTAFATFNQNFWAIDLSTGGAVPLGSLGPANIRSISVAPIGMIQFASPSFNANEGTGTATITVNRTAGSSGTATVQFQSSDGTAVEGSDYTGVSGTLTFAPGETSKTFSMAIADDLIFEPVETINIALANASGAALGVQRTATLNIVENDNLTLYGITDSNSLIQFNSSTPNLVVSTQTISGLQFNEQILAIDFRPANAVLYALGSSSRLYRINTTTAVATVVGVQFSTPLSGSVFGFDFDPLTDRARILSDLKSNFVVNPDSGVATEEGQLRYAAGDIDEGQVPQASAAAYTNNFSTANAKALYAIDYNLGVLAKLDDPMSGEMATVATFNQALDPQIGFDVSTNGTAFVSLFTGGSSKLFRIDLATGALTQMGTIGAVGRIRGIAVALSGAFQFSAANFETEEAAGFTTVTVTRTSGNSGTASVQFSIVSGSAIGGSDFLPATGTLDFADGETTKSFDVQIVDDADPEGTETINLALSSLGGSVIGNPSTAVLSLSDRDISGVVRDAQNNPVSGIAISNGSQTAVTGPDGIFRFNNLASGGYTLRPVLPGRAFEPAERNVVVTGSSITGQDFMLLAFTDDTDNDGFSNEIETAAGTSPTNPSSTPFDGQAAGAPQVDNNIVSKITISLSFKPLHFRADSITIIGSLPAVQNPEGTVIFDVGGNIITLQLDSKGKSTSETNIMKLSKAKDGRTKFTAKLTQGDFSARLEDEGLDNIKNGTKTVVVPIKIYFKPSVLTTTKTLKYRIQVAKKGTAKG